jgi:hypothetical protein
MAETRAALHPLPAHAKGLPVVNSVVYGHIAAQKHKALYFRLRFWLDYLIFTVSLFSIVFWEVRGTTQLVSVGSLNVKVLDPLSPMLVLLLGCLVIDKRKPSWPIMVYLGLYLLIFIRGFAERPLGANDGLRQDIVFLCLLLCVSTGGWLRLGTNRIVRLFTIAALAIGLLSVFRHIFGFTLFADANRTEEVWQLFNDGRTLSANGVVLLSVTVILRLLRQRINKPHDRAAKAQKNRLQHLITLFILAIIVLSGQRTASLGLALALVFFSSIRFRFVTVIAMGLVVIAALVASAVPAASIEALFGGKSGTVQYRQLIWDGFFNDMRSWPLSEVLFGRPLGDRAEFYVGNALWRGSLHSAYVGTISLMGYVGLAVTLASTVPAFLYAYFKYLRYERTESIFPPELRLMLGSVFFVFGFSYEWRELSGLMFAVLVAPYSNGAGAERRPVRAGFRPSDGTGPIRQEQL